jgi:hypothetical protein
MLAYMVVEKKREREGVNQADYIGLITVSRRSTVDVNEGK